MLHALVSALGCQQVRIRAFFFFTFDNLNYHFIADSKTTKKFPIKPSIFSGVKTKTGCHHVLVGRLFSKFVIEWLASFASLPDSKNKIF